jgi:L-lactate dehydrogenase complex protein LldF
MTGPESFEQNAERALADAQLRKNFAFAMGNFIMKRKAVFSDAAETEQLRARGHAIKQRALNRLPELLEELEANCTRNGIRVHWAETPAVANRIVLDIVNAHSATGVVKGKSMVSEEMHLNAYLATHGVEPIETDLGEFIIQLNGETPPTSSSRPSIRINVRSRGSSTRSCRGHPTPRRWPSSTPLHAARCAAGSTRPPWG